MSVSGRRPSPASPGQGDRDRLGGVLPGAVRDQARRHPVDGERGDREPVVAGPEKRQHPDPGQRGEARQEQPADPVLVLEDRAAPGPEGGAGGGERDGTEQVRRARLVPGRPGAPRDAPGG